MTENRAHITLRGNVDYQTAKTRPLDIAFVLEADSLRHLATVLGESGRYLEYTVKLADGTSVRYPDIEEVIKQPNLRENAIVSLIAGTPTEDFQSAYVVLRKDPAPTVEYTVNGPQQKVVYLAYKLDQWVATIQQWHSRFYLSGYAGVALLVAIAAPILLWNGVVSHFFPNVPKDSTPYPWQKSVWIVGMWVLEGFATKLFPKATFAVGQGAKRYETVKKVRVALFYAIPSAVILSLIAAWIHDHY